MRGARGLAGDIRQKRMVSGAAEGNFRARSSLACTQPMRFIEASCIYRHSGHADSVYTLCGVGGSTFLSAGAEGVVARWDGASGNSLGAVLKTTGAIYSIGCAADKALLVVGQADGGLHFFDLKHHQLLRSVQAHVGGIYDFAFLADGGMVAAGGDGKVTMWGADCTLQRMAAISNQPLRTLALSPTGDQLAVAGKDGAIYLLDPATLVVQQTYPAHTGIIMTLAYSLDGRYLYSAGRDAYLNVWDRVERFSRAQQVVAHTGTIHHLLFSTDGAYLASASMDKTVKIWQPATLQLLRVLDSRRDGGHTNAVNRLCWLPTTPTDAGPLRHLVSCSDDRQVLHWGLRVLAEQ
jgi:WD repeat-containing protein 61